MPQYFPISIDRVVDLLQLERDPKAYGGGAKYKVRCPFCGDRKYHMIIDTDMNAYKCFHCGGEKTGGGALDLYSRAVLGERLRPGKKKDGGNGDEIYARLAEALNMGRRETHTEQFQAKHESPDSIRPAPDAALDAAYSAILRFEPFHLTEKHRENLLRRGLDEESITRNGYCSASDFSWTNQERGAIAFYKRYGLRSIFRQYPSLRGLTFQQHIAGMVLAEALVKRGISLNGVPGFFQLPVKGCDSVQTIWVFRMESGMLIPTRNHLGQVVCLQARKDTGALRYMTVSSKGLPNAVTQGISRAHFPLGNRPLRPDTKVLLTEGPLKADTALHLMSGDRSFIALHGVNNRGELPQIFRMLREKGIAAIYNAFDMDKITNPHVAANSKSAQELANEYGIDLLPLYWDESYAHAKYFELLGLCSYHGIEADSEQAKTIFQKTERLAEGLWEQDIRYNVVLDPFQGERKHYWCDETKGIDDYLLTNRKVESGIPVPENKKNGETDNGECGKQKRSQTDIREARNLSGHRNRAEIVRPRL